MKPLIKKNPCKEIKDIQFSNNVPVKVATSAGKSTYSKPITKNSNNRDDKDVVVVKFSSAQDKEQQHPADHFPRTMKDAIAWATEKWPNDTKNRIYSRAKTQFYRGKKTLSRRAMRTQQEDF